MYINKTTNNYSVCMTDREGGRSSSGLAQAKALRNSEEITDKTGHRCWRGLGFLSHPPPPPPPSPLPLLSFTFPPFIFAFALNNVLTAVIF